MEAAVEVGEDDEVPAVLRGVIPGTEEAVLRLSRAGTLLLVFHLAESPGEPFRREHLQQSVS